MATRKPSLWAQMKREFWIGFLAEFEPLFKQKNNLKKI